MKTLQNRPVQQITLRAQRRYYAKNGIMLFGSNPDRAKEWVIHMVSKREIEKMRKPEVMGILEFGVEITGCHFDYVLFAQTNHLLDIARFVLKAIQKGVFPWEVK